MSDKASVRAQGFKFISFNIQKVFRFIFFLSISAPLAMIYVHSLLFVFVRIYSCEPLSSLIIDIMHVRISYCEFRENKSKNEKSMRPVMVVPVGSCPAT